MGTLPLLRWPGGKRWFVARYAHLFKRDFRNYIEPFLGGGSAFFELMPSAATLVDINQGLISTYDAIRDDPDTVEKKFLSLLRRHSRKNYYTIRAASPTDRYDAAARLIYLNKTCFNGIYRVNRQGLFNVPIGDRTAAKYTHGQIAQTAKALEGAQLIHGDFSVVRDVVAADDLIYLDPPYAIDRQSDGFVRYNEKVFSWADQLRLAELAEACASRTASVVVTNAHHPLLIELYKRTDLFDVQTISRFSSVSAAVSKRATFTELLITSRNMDQSSLGGPRRSDRT